MWLRESLVKFKFMFRLIKKSKRSKARLGVLTTARGKISTPFFMPVATRGALKHLGAEETKRLKPQILLANTYHLMLRPGVNTIKKAGGLGCFMNWPGPILTDSGGFQVFSLAGRNNKPQSGLVKLNDRGVEFRSYIDGSKHFLTPEKSLKLQKDMGVDIAVCLDECVALPSTTAQISVAVNKTTAWAARTKKYYQKIRGKKPFLFAVVQGGLDMKQRLRSLQELTTIGFDGYNIGGLSVGETAEEMYAVLDFLLPKMPTDKPRYLMGVGYPENILTAVKKGVDMFDCVIPTREGRHGRLYLFAKEDDLKGNFYKTININNRKFFNNSLPINKDSRFKDLREYSLGYLHYLFKISEPLGQRLATLNNLEFYLDLMSKIRLNIRQNKL